MDFLNSLDWQALVEEHWPTLLNYGLRAIGALVLILIGLRLAGWLSSRVKKAALKRENIDDTLGSFFASLVRWTVTAAVFIAALQVFGVTATSFVAVLGALTLAIGLSMQGALGNIASGIMIILFRPYALNDYIEAAVVSGTVKEINLFQTVLATPDNVKILVPNSKAIDGVIKNYSGYDTRRVDFTIGIDYDDDMDKALSVITGLVNADKRIKDDPEPFIKVTNLGDSSVDITVRAWVEAAEFWDVKFTLTKAVKSALDAEGISIPYPHTVMVTKAG